MLSEKKFRQNEHKYKEIAHLYSLTFTQEDVEDLQAAYKKHECGIIEHILIQVYNHTGSQKHLPRRD